MTRHTTTGDDLTTTGPNGQQTLKRDWTWVGYVLACAGIALLGVGLTAAGYGFYGWTWIIAAASTTCVVVGVCIVIFEHRRRVNSESEDHPDTEHEHRYLPRGFSGNHTDSR